MPQPRVRKHTQYFRAEGKSDAGTRVKSGILACAGVHGVALGWEFNFGVGGEAQGWLRLVCRDWLLHGYYVDILEIKSHGCGGWGMLRT